MSFDVKFVEAIAVMGYLKDNLHNAYHNESPDSFAISYEHLQFILDSLHTSIDNGETIVSFKKQLKLNGIELPKDLPETFFRTIKVACYNAGRWERFVAVKDTQPYLMYDAINDSRVRNNHLAIDGIIRPVDDVFWKTHSPPNGINCRCRLISLNERQAQERSGNGTGLNKFITCKMKPDEGWDFNVGTDLLKFMKVGVLALAKKDAIYSNC